MFYYANLSGNSGVREYEFTANGIAVTYRNGSRYLYTVTSAGCEHIEAMKSLAREGRGLGTYINEHVRNRYEAKLR